jgi:hypothetical protein
MLQDLIKMDLQVGWRCFLRKFSGSPVATSPFIFGFTESAHMATGALDSTVQVAIPF